MAEENSRYDIILNVIFNDLNKVNSQLKDLHSNYTKLDSVRDKEASNQSKSIALTNKETAAKNKNIEANKRLNKSISDEQKIILDNIKVINKNYNLKKKGIKLNSDQEEQNRESISNIKKLNSETASFVDAKTKYIGSLTSQQAIETERYNSAKKYQALQKQGIKLTKEQSAIVKEYGKIQKTRVSDSFTNEQKALLNYKKDYQDLQNLQKQGIKLTDQQKITLKESKTAFDNSSMSVENLGKKHKGLLRSMTEMRWLLVNVTLALGAVYAGYRTIIKPMIDMESAMADVRKTTNLSSEQTKELTYSLLDMSRRLPITGKELAGIATIAGQLGIKGTKNIENFTETAARMAIATDLTAEEAGKGLAKISQAFNLPISNVSALGSAINELSNTTAATSSEIVSSLQKVGAAASSLGVGVDFVMGLQATLISAGMQPERAATRLRSVFTSMSTNIDKLSSIVGEDPLKFKQMLEDNPENTILNVISAIDNYGSGLDKTAKTTEIFGKVGSVVVQTLSENYNLLEENVDTANKAMRENISLIVETYTKLETTASAMQLLKNELNATVSGPGNIFGKTFKEMIDGFRLMNEVGFGPVFYDARNYPLISDDELKTPKILDERKVEQARIIYGLLGNDVEELQAILIKMADATSDPIGQINFLRDVTSQLIITNGLAVNSLEELNEGIGRNSDSYYDNVKLISQAKKELKANNRISDETTEKLKNQTKELNNLKQAREKALNALRLFEDTQSGINKLFGKEPITSESFSNIFSDFNDFFKQGISDWDILKNKADEYFKYIESSGKKAEDIGINKQAVYEYIRIQSGLEQLEKESKKTTEELANAKEDLDKSIKPLNSDMEKEQEQLENVKNKLSALREEAAKHEDQVKNILSRRFNIGGVSETEISNIISKQQLELQKSEFAALGLGSAEEFLRNASVLTTESIDNQTLSIKKLTEAADNGESQFDAWQTSLQETIKALLINSQNIDKDVTNVIKKAQTELLSINAFDSSSDTLSTTAMQNNLNALGMAQDIFFGEEQQKLKYSEQLREDRVNGMNSSADSAIRSLGIERNEISQIESKEKDLIDTQSEYEDSILTLQSKIDNLNVSYQTQVDVLNSLKEAREKTFARIQENANTKNEIPDVVSNNEDMQSVLPDYRDYYRPGMFQDNNSQSISSFTPGLKNDYFIPQKLGVSESNINNTRNQTNNVNIVIDGYNKDPEILAVTVKRNLSNFAYT